MFLDIYTNADYWLAISSYPGKEHARMSVVSSLPAVAFVLCSSATKDVGHRTVFDQFAFVSVSSLRMAWSVKALIFIQTFSVLCNHKAQGIQTYAGTLISICMDPLLPNSHTKGRQAVQPREPGGKQWDFSSPQP